MDSAFGRSPRALWAGGLALWLAGGALPGAADARE
jgi:hypothetical protein